MFPSSTKRIARSGTIITEIPPAALSQTTTGDPSTYPSPLPPALAASSILHFRDDFKLSISASEGRFSESNVDLPRIAAPNIHRIPFLALLGVLQVARDVHCLVVVKEQEAVSYDAAIYRITKVMLHQIGSFTLPEAEKEELSPIEPVANASPGSSPSSSPSSWSSTFTSAAGSISNAAGLGFSGIKAVGSTLKSSIGAVVPATAESLSDPTRVMEAVAELLSSGHFYHSERDLTRTLQVGRHERWDWSTLNKEFAWNHFLTKSLPPSLLPRVLPIVQGHINYISVDSPVPHRIMLIARRGCRRGGRRYIHRGLDPEGHAANLVEVEQIVTSFTSDSVQRTSFVQTRGSVPLLWTQTGLSPKPDIQIDTSLSSQTRAMRRHFRRLTSSHNMDRIRIINLLESSGREAILSSVFRDVLANLALDGITYTEFDFHRECAGLQFGNVKKLIDLLDHELESAGCFWVHEDTRRRSVTPDPVTSPTSATVEVGGGGGASPGGGQASRQMQSPSEASATAEDGVNVLLKQTLLVRCNCLDSLDRTNVVQTWIARKALDMQMLRMGLELAPRVEKSHAEAWANLGDTLSQCYTGTDALKGDFTRTGKRNMQGAAMDLRKSVERMYKNSIRDWFDQSVMDILLGHRSWLPAQVHTVTREFSAEEALVAAWTAKLASPPSSPTAGPVASPANVPSGGTVPDSAKSEGGTATPTSPSPTPLFASVTLVLTSRNILVRPSATESMQPIPLNQIQEIQVVTHTLADPSSHSHAVQVVLRDPSTPPLFMDLTPLVPPPGKSLPGTITAGSLPASPAPSSPITLPGSPLKHASTAPGATPPSTPPSQRRAGYGGALFKRALSAFAWGSSPAAADGNDAANGGDGGGADTSSTNGSLPVTPVKGNDGAKTELALAGGTHASVPSAVVDLITAVQETALRELNHVIRGI